MALKLDVRAAATDSTPGLDKALFGRSRPKQQPATTTTTDTPTPVATPDTTAPTVKAV